MIIGINTDHPFQDKRIDLSLKKTNLPVSEVLYHETTLSILDNFKDIRLLIVPTNIEGNNQYAFINLIEHIRLSYNFPIFVYKNGELDITSENQLDKILTNEECEQYLEETIDTNSLNLLSNEQRNNIISNINPKRPNSSGHDMSNKWGPYKLLKTMNFFNSSINYKKIENLLSENLYFKKIIYLNDNSTDNIPDKLKNEIVTKLNFLRGQNKKICLIDDESHRGWEKVYKQIFKSSDFKSTYKIADGKNATKKDFQTFKNKFNLNENSYDLIILDLRLFERTADNIVDTELFHNLSGIQILNISKNNFPDTPVIISTASDKAWNYENIINCGANGFWTKESPDLNYSNSHSFNNLYNLLNNITKCLVWRNNTHEIFTKLDKIYTKYSSGDARIANQVNIKKKAIFSQLHMEYSNFLKKYSNQSGYEFGFESSWGLLINDIADVKDTSDILPLLKDFNYYDLETKEKLLKNLINNKGFISFLKGINQNYNGINKFINESQPYGSILKDNFKYLRKLRNYLPTTHGSDASIQSNKLSSISISDIQNLINLCCLVAFEDLK